MTTPSSHSSQLVTSPSSHSSQLVTTPRSHSSQLVTTSSSHSSQVVTTPKSHSSQLVTTLQPQLSARDQTLQPLLSALRTSPHIAAPTPLIPPVAPRAPVGMAVAGQAPTSYWTRKRCQFCLTCKNSNRASTAKAYMTRTSLHQHNWTARPPQRYKHK